MFKFIFNVIFATLFLLGNTYLINLSNINVLNITEFSLFIFSSLFITSIFYLVFFIVINNSNKISSGILFVISPFIMLFFMIIGLASSGYFETSIPNFGNIIHILSTGTVCFLLMYSLCLMSVGR